MAPSVVHGQGQPPAGPAHAGEFPCRSLRASDEHDPEGRDHRVEAGIRERQRLGIPQPVIDGETARQGARCVEQPCGDVNPGDFGAAPGAGARRDAGAGRDVEDAFTRLRRQRGDGRVDAVIDAADDLFIVPAAQTPHGRGALVVRLNGGGGGDVAIHGILLEIKGAPNSVGLWGADSGVGLQEQKLAQNRQPTVNRSVKHP
jgi:hypothetical protein